MERVGRCIFVKTSPGYRWLHKSFGTNLHITELQSTSGQYNLNKVKNGISLGKIMQKS